MFADPLHISLPLYSFLQTAGPYAYASEISDGSARLNVEVPVQNGGLRPQMRKSAYKLLGEDGKPVTQMQETGSGGGQWKPFSEAHRKHREPADVGAAVSVSLHGGDRTARQWTGGGHRQRISLGIVPPAGMSRGPCSLNGIT